MRFCWIRARCDASSYCHGSRKDAGESSCEDTQEMRAGWQSERRPSYTPSEAAGCGRSTSPTAAMESSESGSGSAGRRVAAGAACGPVAHSSVGDGGTPNARTDGAFMVTRRRNGRAFEALFSSAP